MLTGLSVIEAFMVLYELKHHKLYAQSEYAGLEDVYTTSEGSICKTNGYDILDTKPTVNVSDILGETIVGIAPITWCVGTMEEVMSNRKRKSFIDFIENPRGLKVKPELKPEVTEEESFDYDDDD